MPKLIVNRRYYAELKSGPQNKASKAWLSECLASAGWLVKALDQRARTIVKVASAIVERQEGFFREGVRNLKPLTLREVAAAVEVHESTVSRVTSNKYLLCERGLFELKYFFGSGVGADEAGEGGASAEAVKSAIGKLIAAETEILSDDTLVDLLKAEGFDLARRTVAKYREAMGIGSSIQRRRQRAMSGRLNAQPRPHRQMIRRTARGLAVMDPGGIDPQIRIDDDPVERGDRAARMEARAGRGEPVFVAQILEAAGGDAPFVGVAHQHGRHALRARGDVLQDRPHLPPPPKAAEVEVHADDPDRPVAGNQQLRQHRATRLEHRQIDDSNIDDLDMVLHQQSIAVPADVARFELEQPLGMMAVRDALEQRANG